MSREADGTLLKAIELLHPIGRLIILIYRWEVQVGEVSHVTRIGETRLIWCPTRHKGIK